MSLQYCTSSRACIVHSRFCSTYRRALYPLLLLILSLRSFDVLHAQLQLVTVLLPQSLQLPKNNNVRVQEPIHALPHTRLLVLVQLAVLNTARGNAFAETCVGQGVDGLISLAFTHLKLRRQGVK